MKFLEKIKKINEYIKNLEFQKKIILALIVVLVIANLVLGIFLFSQKNVSVVKVESLVDENRTSLIALGGNARSGSIKNTDYAFFKFTENQKENENPHQYQTPSMSAIILKSHVKEGVELAKAYKLPCRVIDVIKQHHGTSLMKYFYKKAILLKAEDEEIDDRIFRYDGPKPQFKESAIISIADAIEAASRSLEKVTPQSVNELIDKIIKDKIDSEQLNECSITLQDLDVVRKSFQVSLLSMLHARVSYEDIKVEKPL
jgi:hypothetical protein